MLLAVILISVAITILPTFFTTGISRVELKQEFDLPLVLNDKKEIKLIFFGYSGCIDICTPRLISIAKFYSSLSPELKQHVGVEFLDISTPEDKTLPTQFAQYFNSDFKGIYLPKDVLRNYTKIFSVYFSKSLLDETEYDHSSHLYIVKRTGDKKELRYIYNSYPFDFKQIKLDIEELLNE
ncbi:MAG: hypothetical protein GQ570_04875 [Helicobacteraceae bacterium]|nr:hypothetical protein [Helicobacteraceae bacterium]